MRMRMSETDHETWHRFLEAMQPALEILGSDANVVVGAQFGEVDGEHDEYDDCAITSNLPIHETAAAIRDMQIVADSLASQQVSRDDLAELAVLAILSDDEGIVDTAIEVIRTADPEGWAVAEAKAELFVNTVAVE